MSDAPLQPRSTQTREVENYPYGLGLATQLLSTLKLSNEAEDRVIVEMAMEIDRLEMMLGEKDPPLRGSVKSTTSFRRATILQKLYELLMTRRERQGKAGEVAIVASIIRKLQATLKDLNLKPELQESIVMTLIKRMDTDDSKAKDKKV